MQCNALQCRRVQVRPPRLPPQSAADDRRDPAAAAASPGQPEVQWIEGQRRDIEETLVPINI